MDILNDPGSTVEYESCCGVPDPVSSLKTPDGDAWNLRTGDLRNRAVEVP